MTRGHSIDGIIAGSVSAASALCINTAVVQAMGNGEILPITVSKALR